MIFSISCGEIGAVYAAKAAKGRPSAEPGKRAFAAGGRNGLRAGGIACMPAREGRPYLAAATGAFSRKAAGRTMSGRIAEKAAIDSIGRAVGREGPPDDGGLVSHDGQGAQYAHYSKKQLVRRLEQSIAKRTTIDASPEGLPIGRPRTAFRPCPKRARGVLPTRAPLFPTTDRKLPGLPPR